MEFLEVATYLVLFCRGVYPPQIFDERMKYGAPVRIPRHPALRDYVASVVLSLRPWLTEVFTGLSCQERIVALGLGQVGHSL